METSGCHACGLPCIALRSRRCGERRALRLRCWVGRWSGGEREAKEALKQDDGLERSHGFAQAGVFEPAGGFEQTDGAPVAERPLDRCAKVWG